MRRRVVVTGMGVISPVGNDVESFWAGLCEGRSGIGPITRFDTTGLPVSIAGEVKGFDPSSFVDKKEARRMDRFCQYAVAATAMAVEESGLVIEGDIADRTAVILGTGIGGIETLCDQQVVLGSRGHDRVSPLFIPMMIANMGAGQVSIQFGARGPNHTVVTACAASAHAIGEAFRIIERGEADFAITGGSESPIVPLALAGFSQMKALSTRNDDPSTASRPFSLTRDGFVMAEGAGILILESLDRAAARGARIRAEVLGYGSTADAFHISAPSPDGDGGARAMAAALRDAGLEVQEIDYINAHGTSTPLNDRLETVAIKRVFGDIAPSIPVSSTKSMTGHLLGAAGAVECIVSILTCERGIIPPTINLNDPDPDCDLDYVPNVSRAGRVRTVLSNSFGFGGQNACLVLGTRPW